MHFSVSRNKASRFLFFLVLFAASTIALSGITYADDIEIPPPGINPFELPTTQDPNDAEKHSPNGWIKTEFLSRAQIKVTYTGPSDKFINAAETISYTELFSGGVIFEDNDTSDDNFIYSVTEHPFFDQSSIIANFSGNIDTADALGGGDKQYSLTASDLSDVRLLLSIEEDKIPNVDCPNGENANFILFDQNDDDLPIGWRCAVNEPGGSIVGKIFSGIAGPLGQLVYEGADELLDLIGKAGVPGIQDGEFEHMLSRTPRALAIGSTFSELEKFNITYVVRGPAGSEYNFIEHVSSKERDFRSLTWCGAVNSGAGAYRNDACNDDTFTLGDTDEDLKIKDTSPTVPFVSRLINEATGNFVDVMIAGVGSNILSETPSLGGGAIVAADPSCESSISGIGWGLCPVARQGLKFLEETVRDGVVSSILEFDVLSNTETGQRDALYSIWVGFRTIANVGFVIAFFVVIYAAATGGALSSYDIKRLLPKILIGSVAVQLSFFICLQLIDIFNALGNGIVDIMMAPLEGTGTGIDRIFSNNANTSSNLSGLSGQLTAAVSVLILVLLLIAFVFAAIGIIKLIVVFLLRNMALIVLTTLSPLAFVAWIMPNTESMFKKWWNYYIQLLSLYPMAMAFLTSGALVSYIFSHGSNSWANQWIGVIAVFLPYVVADRYLAATNATTSALSKAVNTGSGALKEGFGRTKKGFGKARAAKKWADNTRVGAQFKAGELEGKWSRLNKLSVLSNPGKVLNTKRGRTRSAANAATAYSRIVKEDEQAADVLFNREIAGKDQEERKRITREQAVNGKTEEIRAAAMRRMIVDNDFDALQSAMITEAQRGASGRAAVTRFQNSNAGDLAAKARHLLTADVAELGDQDGTLNLSGASNLANASGEQIRSQHGSSVRAAVAELSTAMVTGTDEQKDKAQKDLANLVKTFNGLNDQDKSNMGMDSKDAIELARHFVENGVNSNAQVSDVDNKEHGNGGNAARALAKFSEQRVNGEAITDAGKKGRASMGLAVAPGASHVILNEQGEDTKTRQPADVVNKPRSGAAAQQPNDQQQPTSTNRPTPEDPGDSGSSNPR